MAPLRALQSWVEKEQLKGIKWNNKHGYRPKSAKHVNSPGCYKSESVNAALAAFVTKYKEITKQLRAAGIRWNMDVRRTEIRGLRPTSIKINSSNGQLQGADDELKQLVTNMVREAEGQVNRIMDVEAFGIANAAKSIPMETIMQSFLTAAGQPITLGALKQHIGHPTPLS